MFDVKMVPATPAWARRLVRFSQLKHIEFSSEIKNIAEQDTIVRVNHDNLTTAQLNAVQFLVDHNHRAILLDDGTYTSRDIVCESLSYFNKEGTKLILANTSQHKVWANIISRYFPEQTIFVLGPHRNSQHFDDIKNCKVSNHMGEYKTDWIISTYGQVFHDDILMKHRPVFLVSEEINAQSRPPQRYNDALKGLFAEVQSTIFIYNVAQSSPYDSVDFNTSIQQRFAGNNQHILIRLIDYLWTVDNSTRIFEIERNTNISSYLSNHQYHNIDMLKLLPLFGVSVDLLQQNHADKNLLYMNNNVLVKLRYSYNNNIKGLERGLISYLKVEQKLSQENNIPVDKLYSKGVTCDQIVNETFERFKNNNWCNFKAQYVRQIIDQMALNQHKTLILAENEGIIRSIRLAVCCEELATSKHYDNCIARYIYPSPEWRKYSVADIPPIYNHLCVSAHDLSNQDLLNNTQIIILAEIPQRFHVYRTIVDACKRYDIKLIHPIITSSFEDHLLQSHKAKLQTSN